MTPHGENIAGQPSRKLKAGSVGFRLTVTREQSGTFILAARMSSHSRLRVTDEQIAFEFLLMRQGLRVLRPQPLHQSQAVDGGLLLILRIADGALRDAFVPADFGEDPLPQRWQPRDFCFTSVTAC